MSETQKSRHTLKIQIQYTLPQTVGDPRGHSGCPSTTRERSMQKRNAERRHKEDHHTLIYRMDMETATAAAMFAATCCCYYIISIATRSSSKHHPTRTLSKEEIIQLRHKHFSKSLSVSFANSNPLLIVKVSGQHQTVLLFVYDYYRSGYACHVPFSPRSVLSSLSSSTHTHTRATERA